MDHAVISSIKWFVYLNFQLGRQPTKVTRVLKNALKDIDFKPKRKLVPLLGMLTMSYISTTTFIYHHWSHSSAPAQHQWRARWCNNLKMNKMRPNSMTRSVISAAAGCDGARQYWGWRLWRLATGRLWHPEHQQVKRVRRRRAQTHPSVSPEVDVWTM